MFSGKTMIKNPGKMRGVALFVALIMLLLLTMIGLSAMQSSLTELKISSNLQEKIISTQASKKGIDATMCLVSQGTADENPFNKRHKIDPDIVDEDDANYDPSKQYEWIDIDDANPIYDEDPFEDVSGNATTVAACSVASGIIGDGSSTQNTETLTVSTKQIASKIICPRMEAATSPDDLKCNGYIVRSEHEYTSSGAKTSTWAGVYRQVLPEN